jgi:transcriptional regulator with XRE-family HTH domain
MPKKPRVHPLRAWRLRHGLTQKELAAMLGIHYSNITYWETGERPIPPLRAWKIQKALGIRVEVLRPDIFGA